MVLWVSKVPRMATPKLPPIWRMTLKIPEAWAISRLEISVSAMALRGVKISPNESDQKELGYKKPGVVAD